MVAIKISLLFLIIFSEQVVTQNIRSFEMTVMDGWQFQCANTTCSPYFTTTTASILQCQVTCLGQTQCQAVSFRQSTSYCQLFTNGVNQSYNLEQIVATVTMIVISDTRTVSGTYRDDVGDVLNIEETLTCSPMHTPF